MNGPEHLQWLAALPLIGGIVHNDSNWDRALRMATAGGLVTIAIAAGNHAYSWVDEVNATIRQTDAQKKEIQGLEGAISAIQTGQRRYRREARRKRQAMKRDLEAILSHMEGRFQGAPNGQ